MSRELSRRELYDLVWDRPLTKIAVDLGISDVALHKICVRHRIPLPGRGYWAKLTAGKRVARTPFREIQDQNLNRITIQGDLLAVLPVKVQEARSKTRAALESAPRSIEAIKTPALIASGLHTLVKATHAKIASCKRPSDEFVSVTGNKHFAVTCTVGQADRVGRILDRLVTQAQAIGYLFEQSDSGMRLVANDEKITLTLIEQNDRQAHVQTEKETAALAKWKAESELRARRGQWVSEWDRPRIPEWDYLPSGRLQLELDKGYHYDRIRRKFSDGKRQRIEDLLDQVLTSAAMIAANEKAKREQALLRKLEYEEADRRRKEADRLERLRAKRWELLEQQMSQLEKAQRAENFILAFREANAGQELTMDCEKFLQWTEAEARRLRSALSPEVIARMLEQHRLMDDTTDIYSWAQFH